MDLEQLSCRDHYFVPPLKVGLPQGQLSVQVSRGRALPEGQLRFDLPFPGCASLDKSPGLCFCQMRVLD